MSVVPVPQYDRMCVDYFTGAAHGVILRVIAVLRKLQSLYTTISCHQKTKILLRIVVLLFFIYSFLTASGYQGNYLNNSHSSYHLLILLELVQFQLHRLVTYGRGLLPLHPKDTPIIMFILWIDWICWSCVCCIPFRTF